MPEAPVLRLHARIAQVQVGESGQPILVLRCEKTEALTALVEGVGADCVVGLVITERESATNGTG